MVFAPIGVMAASSAIMAQRSSMNARQKTNKRKGNLMNNDTSNTTLMHEVAEKAEKRGRKRAVVEATDKPEGEYVHVQAVTAIPQDVLDVQHGEPRIVTFANGYKAWYPEAHALKLKDENPDFVVSIEKGE